MYADKFVVAVKHNGRVLREQGDTVLIPFGSEYALHFKNLNSVRVQVKVSIDGTDATQGTCLVIRPNETADLERFIRSGDGGQGHRFKFIERTQKIEDGPRGIRVDDGLIRVEFEYERQPAKIEYETIKRTYINDYWTTPRPYYPLWNSTTTTTFGSAEGSVTCSDVSYSANAASSSPLRSKGVVGEVTAQSASLNSATMDSFVGDVGITVPGSISDQKFEVAAWFPTDGQKHVMVLRLKGRVGEQKVERPVTVKTMQECPTCGTKNKHGTKFCRECGTGLALI